MIRLIALNAKYPHTNLAVRYIKKELDALKMPCEMFEGTVNMPLRSLLQSIYDANADVYCFSCYIWNIEHVLKIASDLKKLTDAKIYLGGPEVCFEQEHFESLSYVDGVFTGDERQAAYELAGRHGQPIPIEEVGVGYTAEELVNLKDRISYYEGSRGCPFGCTFCLSSLSFGFELKSAATVKRELSFFCENKTPIVKLLDRTFNADDDWACEIIRFLAASGEGRHAFTLSFHLRFYPNVWWVHLLPPPIYFRWRSAYRARRMRRSHLLTAYQTEGLSLLTA